MKACICLRYGSPDILEIKEIEKPSPGENELLVKVYATTVNRTDLGILRGSPFLIRIFAGLSRPRLVVTGTDFAGEVVAIGKNVKSFKIGDKVAGFGGMGLQSHAEYLTISDDKAVIPIPLNLNYHQAAACLEAPFMRWEASTS